MNPDNQMDLIPRAGMFTALAPLAKKGTVMLMISSEGDNLRVNVTNKGKNDSDSLSISLFAPPAELDADLPAALATARGTAPVLKSVADQVSDQVKPQKPAAEKKTTPAKPAPAAKKKAIAKPRPAVKAQPVKSAKKSAPKKSAAKPAARAKFTRDQCLAEYARLKGVHGDKLTMDVYSKNAKCDGADIGRSFERMFSGWKKFAKAGEKRIAETAPPASAHSGRMREVYLNGKVIDKGSYTVVLGEIINIAGLGLVRVEEIFNDCIRVVAAPQTQKASTAPVRIPGAWPEGPKPIERDVYDTEGTLVGKTSQQPTVHELLNLKYLPPMKVVSVDEKRITVEVAGETAGA